MAASNQLGNMSSLLKSKINEDPNVDHSLFMVDIGEVIRKHREFQAHLPRVSPFYAVKCNPDFAILRTLSTLGLGFDCASPTEIDTVLSMGVDASRIIYANPCKSMAALKHALKAGVKLMTFDNEDELRKIKTTFPSAKLVLRILVEDGHSILALGKKFGAHPQRAWPLLSLARELSLDVVGVSFHVGSGCECPEAFTEAVKSARSVFDIGKEIGFNFTLLDVGGGFPGTEDVVTFEQVSSTLSKALNTFFPSSNATTQSSSSSNTSNVHIIAEPGRFYATSSHTLALSVIGRRRVENTQQKQRSTASPHHLAAIPPTPTSAPDSGFVTSQSATSSTVGPIFTFDSKDPWDTATNTDVSFMYYLNDGVWGNLNNTLFEHTTLHPRIVSKSNLTRTGGRPRRGSSVVSRVHIHVQAPHEDERNENNTYVSSLWGPTCDSLDCMAKEIALPELQVGDWLLLENMGAYTKALVTHFNGMPPARCYYVNTEHENAPEVNVLGLKMVPKTEAELL